MLSIPPPYPLISPPARPPAELPSVALLLAHISTVSAFHLVNYALCGVQFWVFGEELDVCSNVEDGGCVDELLSVLGLFL